MEEIEDVDNSPAINPLPYHPLGPLLGDALPQASWDQPVEGEFEAETLGTGQTDDKSESSSGSSSEESSGEDEGEECYDLHNTWTFFFSFTHLLHYDSYLSRS